jgi:ribonuclease HII
MNCVVADMSPLPQSSFLCKQHEVTTPHGVDCMTKRPTTAKNALPSFRFEEEAAHGGASRIAGVDEAGRGPLAGPVVAGAVVLRPGKPIEGLNDSKLLTARVRERLFGEIREKAVAIGVGVVSVETINRINILQAARLAMTRAVADLVPQPDFLLIDGPIKLDLDLPQRSLVGGDRLSLSVAAGAIIAKVTRDRIMSDLHEQFPSYGFNRNQGYGTQEHRDAIVKYGVSSVHRIHFRGVKEHAQEILLLCDDELIH